MPWSCLWFRSHLDRCISGYRDERSIAYLWYKLAIGIAIATLSRRHGDRLVIGTFLNVQPMIGEVWKVDNAGIHPEGSASVLVHRAAHVESVRCPKGEVWITGPRRTNHWSSSFITAQLRPVNTSWKQKFYVTNKVFIIRFKFTFKFKFKFLCDKYARRYKQDWIRIYPDERSYRIIVIIFSGFKEECKISWISNFYTSLPLKA